MTVKQLQLQVLYTVGFYLLLTEIKISFRFYFCFVFYLNQENVSKDKNCCLTPFCALLYSASCLIFSHFRIAHTKQRSKSHDLSDQLKRVNQPSSSWGGYNRHEQSKLWWISCLAWGKLMQMCPTFWDFDITVSSSGFISENCTIKLQKIITYSLVKFRVKSTIFCKLKLGRATIEQFCSKHGTLY